MISLAHVLQRRAPRHGQGGRQGMMTGIAARPGPRNTIYESVRRKKRRISRRVRRCRHTCPSFRRLVFVTIPLFATLRVAPTHAHIASDADTTTLLSYNTTERGALRQSRELLGAIDGERNRLDFEPMRYVCFAWSVGLSNVIILVLIFSPP